MAVGIGGAGSVGLAFEAVAGTYVAPTHFLPVRSESLEFIDEVQYTRPIMGVVDPVHAVPGPQRVEGDLEFEVIEDIFAFLLHGGRFAVTKTGVGPYNYEFKPSTAAEAPTKTLSITVVRNGVVFGYVGCVVSGLEMTVDNGVLVSTANILGVGEASQGLPTPSFPVTPPFGADHYTIEIPTGSPITDADTFTFSVDESSEAVYRLGNAQQAAFVMFGERSTTMSVERDFESRADYDTFKALTEQELRVLASKSASEQIEILVRAAIKSSYAVGLSGQGDLVRGSIEYEGKYDFTSTEAFLITIDTAENITP